MTALFGVLLLLATSGPLDLSVRPGGEDTFTTIVRGSGREMSRGDFRGALSLNGSPAEIVVAGRAERSPAGWSLPLTLRFADVPADWADRFQPASFQYVLRGRVAGEPPVEWRGTKRWESVGIEGENDSVRRFVKLQSLEVVELSFLESEALAIVAVRNPFSFPLKIASTRYRLQASGREVGEGATRGMLLRPLRVSALSLPIGLDHGALVAAAGRAVLSGGRVDARLRGDLTIRLPRGDLTVPIDLAGDLSVRP
ncbi:MAG: LEA type 2 family protein [Thermoanaerobaculia bacterium]